MDNVVLYRKYRPQNFSEVISQDHVVKTLTNSLQAGSASHAYLFSGPRGSGKTTIARIFAKALNCTKPLKGEPCNNCDSCLEIMASKSLDLIEIDAASHTGVDDVRALIEGIRFSPVKSKYKIFIIDECHQLSKAAANALLKTLEEPPNHVVFILATTESHKMIATIVSRCQRFDFKRLHDNEIIRKLEFILKKEGVLYEPQITSIIALNARGSFRDAESLLDKCISFTGRDKRITVQEIKDLLGIVEVKQVAEFIDLIFQKKTKEAIAHINNLVDQGVDLQEFAKTLVFYARQLLLLKISPDFLSPQNSGFSQEEISTAKNQITMMQEREVQRVVESCIEAEQKMKHTNIIQLPLELAIIDLTIKE